MAANRLTVDRSMLPGVQVGEVVVVEVRALVTKIETEVIDISGYDPKGGNEHAPGNTTTELLVMGLKR